MNSCTSSSDRYRRFAIAFASLTLAALALLYGLGHDLEALDGDLTRIGFYSERDFGWRLAQRAFPQQAAQAATFDRPYDMVVMGDSFSTGRPALRWQNYAALRLGWSVLTLDVHHWTVEQIVGSPAYRASPPKVFVLELVERDLPIALREVQDCDAALTAHPRGPSSPERPGPEGLEGAAWTERLDRASIWLLRGNQWSAIKPGFVRNYLWYGFLREVFGLEVGRARAVALKSPAPVSSRVTRRLLVYVDDLRKAQWWRHPEAQQLTCRIESLRARVESDGRTRFVLMVAPDKLTAYAYLAQDPTLRSLSRLADLESRQGSLMPRVDLALSDAIAKGRMDVYLPNDTHWGSAGNEIAADALVRFLAERISPLR